MFYHNTHIILSLVLFYFLRQPIMLMKYKQYRFKIIMIRTIAK